jgi:hypothetical protein
MIGRNDSQRFLHEDWHVGLNLVYGTAPFATHLLAFETQCAMTKGTANDTCDAFVHTINRSKFSQHDLATARRKS